MKFHSIGAVVALSLFASSLFATEYVYRDLMANTPYSVKCKTLEEAEKQARKPYKLKRYSKKFCQTQGYGWGLEEIMNQGEVVCKSCAEEDLKQCYVKDVVVKCKRIKPGSVGMLPGKG